jgi:hypothetical protein
MSCPPKQENVTYVRNGVVFIYEKRTGGKMSRSILKFDVVLTVHRR